MGCGSSNSNQALNYSALKLGFCVFLRLAALPEGLLLARAQTDPSHALMVMELVVDRLVTRLENFWSIRRWRKQSVGEINEQRIGDAMGVLRELQRKAGLPEQLHRTARTTTTRMQ